MSRVRAEFYGIVQGVGFRPRAFREAQRRALAGWVRNRGDSVELEVEGPRTQIEDLVRTLSECPPPARVDRVARSELKDTHEVGFRIVGSTGSDAASALPPDLAPCSDCERELRDPSNRRHAHPFTSCVACGPRYSIALAMPYDRVRTTMALFSFCDECRREYEAPDDRRYHAEPIACPNCGPTLTLLDSAGNLLAGSNLALAAATQALRAGKIVALRGLGGFQLLVDARNERAVTLLRERKHREEKPFAVLFRDREQLAAACAVTREELQLLESAARPIVLVARRARAELASAIASGLDELGAFLPPTPLLLLLVEALDFPVVCTSGNPSGEPLCTDTDEALARLGTVADAFLVHDRPIARPLDDSVVRHGPAGLEVIRRARGFAPLPVARFPTPVPVLALGAYQKSTLALAWNGTALQSQHLGDLDTRRGVELFERTIDDFLGFYRVEPLRLACDLHPDYPSTTTGELMAARLGVPLLQVQHHHAHVAAVLAEHGVDAPVLGFAWDGTGLGSDGTIWGGEALLVRGATFQRVGHLGQFRLVGGDRVAREPDRSALGLLFEHDAELAADFAEERFGAEAGLLLLRAMERHVNAPITSSAGRLFDAVAALLGIRRRCSYEGQAALELENLARLAPDAGAYDLPLSSCAPYAADVAALVAQIMADRARAVDPARIAARFQASLLAFALAVAARVDLELVVLAGGCFQNRYLRAELPRRLSERGHRVFTAGAVPTNDGGISLGQAWVASHAEP